MSAFVDRHPRDDRGARRHPSDESFALVSPRPSRAKVRRGGWLHAPAAEVGS